MFDIIGKRFWYFLISGLVILIGIISLLSFNLKMGIEFESGSRIQLSFVEQEVTQQQLDDELGSLGFHDTIIEKVIQGTGQSEYLIRTRTLSEADREALKAGLAVAFGSITEQAFSHVSPDAASETTGNVVIAVAAAAVGILLYVTWAFRRMPKPFHYGTCAIIALVHDAVVALGIFSILGAIFNWQIDMAFIIGILSVIGYSVNNTVVIFDRIRENLTRGVGASFEQMVNNSLVETLSRSMNTSLTTLIVVLALFLFIGGEIQNFAVVLIIGIIAGTFSSVCIAPSLLVVWDKKEWGRFIPWHKAARAKA